MIYDKQVLKKLKCEFYTVTILSALLYGTECCATKQMHIERMEVTEMQMLRWMCGKNPYRPNYQQHYTGTINSGTN